MSFYMMFFNRLHLTNFSELNAIIFKLPFFFIGRGFLEVDPNNNVNESDEQNNVVWAYMIGTGSGFEEPPFCLLCYYFIGKLRQQGSSNNIGDYQFTLTDINDCLCMQE